MAVAERVASNLMEVSELMVEDKPAAESVADKRETDFDCWQAIVAESVAATFANTLRWDSPGAKFSDTAIDTVVARVPEDKQAIVVRRTTDRLVIKDEDFAEMASVAIVRCTSVASRNKDCYTDYSRSTVRLDKIPRLLSARLESSRVDIAENEQLVESPVAIPERN